MSRRTSKRSHTTFEGRVVYDRKPHMFNVKDVIRIAKKADFSKANPIIAFELAQACFTLIANAYGQVWSNSLDQLNSLWQLFDAIRAFLGGLGSYLVYYGIEVLDEFIKWILRNFNLIRPPRKE